MKVQKNKIILDDENIVKISKYISYKYDLEDGEEIVGDKKDKIIYEILLEEAYKIISRKLYASKDVSIKLEHKINNIEMIDKIINKLKEDKYINDKEYAKQYIEIKKYGRKRVCYELSKKGISEKEINLAYDELEIDEAEFISFYIKKIAKKEREKQIRYLLRRGFSFDLISEKLGEEE